MMKTDIRLTTYFKEICGFFIDHFTNIQDLTYALARD